MHEKKLLQIKKIKINNKQHGILKLSAIIFDWFSFQFPVICDVCYDAQVWQIYSRPNCNWSWQHDDWNKWKNIQINNASFIIIYECIHFYVFWDSASFQNWRSPMCLCRNCLQWLRQHSHQKKWHKNSTERVCIGFCCCRCGGELHRKFWYFAPPNLFVRSSR